LDIGPGRVLFVLSEMITEAQRKGYSEKEAAKRSLKPPFGPSPPLLLSALHF
jgi:hypothetical protein